MNRHVLGLTLFLIIVKTSVLVYWGLFAPQPLVTFTEITESELPLQPRISSTKTNCFPPREAVNKITYAEIDRKTKTLRMTVRLYEPAAPVSEAKEMSVYLTFGKDRQMRGIGFPELVSATPVYHRGYTELNIITKPDFLDHHNLKNENLYVAANVKSLTGGAESDFENFLLAPTPVLLAH